MVNIGANSTKKSHGATYSKVNDADAGLVQDYAEMPEDYGEEDDIYETAKNVESKPKSGKQEHQIYQ